MASAPPGLTARCLACSRTPSPPPKALRFGCSCRSFPWVARVEWCLHLLPPLLVWGFPAGMSVRSVCIFLEGSTANKPYETESNNRSVMPLDALGRTRATMSDSAGVISLSERSEQPCQSPFANWMFDLRVVLLDVLGPGACNSFPQTRNA